MSNCLRLLKNVIIFYGTFLLFLPISAQNSQLKFELISIESGLSHNSVYSIIQDHQGFMWFGSENGLNRFDGYSMKVFRHEPANENSLSSSNFGKVIQDEDGYLWLATWGGGLNSYDPKTGNFVHYLYNEKDSTSLSQNRIEFVFEDDEGYIWVGTERRGLNRLDKKTGKFKRFLHDPDSPHSIQNNTLKAFLITGVSNDKHLWFGTDRGISILDKSTGKFTHLTHEEDKKNTLSNNYVRTLMEDREGNIWIGTRGGGVNVFDPVTEEMKYYEYDPDMEGCISDNSITNIFQDSFGSIWIGTYSAGLNRFDPETGKFQKWNYDPENTFGLSHDRVEVIYEDRSNNLWIGTRGGGINKLDLKPGNFNLYFYSSRTGIGLVNPIVRSIAGDLRDENFIYIGTDGGGITKFNRKENKFIRHARPSSRQTAFSGSRIWSLLMDSNEKLWTGAYAGGLMYIDLSKRMPTIKIYELENEDSSSFEGSSSSEDSTSLSNNTVHVVYEDRSGIIWVGTAEGLNQVEYFKHSKYPLITKVYKHQIDDSLSISNNYISAIFQSSEKGIWIGTRSGLNHFSPENGTFYCYYNDPDNLNSISNDNIQVIYESTKFPGILWVGTVDGGLNKIEYTYTDNEPRIISVKSYYNNDGLSSNTVEGILEDDAGFLWISTVNGLNRFNPETDEFQLFDVGGNFKDQSFIRNSSYRTKDNELFFGSINGLLSFRPDLVKANSVIPPIELTGFKIYNKKTRLPESYFNKKEINLQHNANYISFEFAALDYTNPKMNHYAYKMSGIDEDWIYLENRIEAVYSNLEPGEYIFKIKGSNNDGVWNNEGLSVNIIVIAPWWRTIWARLFFSFTLLFLGYTIYQFRTRQIKQRANVLEDINLRLKREVKEREKVEDEVRSLNIQLEKRVADRTSQLELSNRELEAFAYTVSHDLRAPLRQIIGFNQAVIEDFGDNIEELGREYLQRTQKSADQMFDFIEQMLKLSRVSQVDLNTDEINLSKMIYSIFEELHKEEPDRKYDLEIQDGINVNADPFLMKQAMSNLIQNAWKYTRKRKKAKFEFREIEITHERTSAYTFSGNAFLLSDNGIGFNMEYTDRLFQPFQRLHGEDEFEGNGIGLAAVERILKRHNGFIWAKSVLNKGTTFYFTLNEPV